MRRSNLFFRIKSSLAAVLWHSNLRTLASCSATRVVLSHLPKKGGRGGIRNRKDMGSRLTGAGRQTFVRRRFPFVVRSSECPGGGVGHKRTISSIRPTPTSISYPMREQQPKNEHVSASCSLFLRGSHGGEGEGPSRYTMKEVLSCLDAAYM